MSFNEGTEHTQRNRCTTGFGKKLKKLLPVSAKTPFSSAHQIFNTVANMVKIMGLVKIIQPPKDRM